MDQLHFLQNKDQQKPPELRSAPGKFDVEGSAGRNVHPVQTGLDSKRPQRVVSPLYSGV